MNLGGQPSDPKALKNLMAKKLGITGTTINQANYFKGYTIITNAGDSKNSVSIPNFKINASNKTSLPYSFFAITTIVANYPQIYYQKYPNFNNFSKNFQKLNSSDGVLNNYAKYAPLGSTSPFYSTNTNENCTNFSADTRITYNFSSEPIDCNASQNRELSLICLEPQNYP